jgi:hypothetical protein
MIINDLVPPGTWGDDKSNIHVIENFIDAEQVDELHRYSRCNDDWYSNQHSKEWADRVHKSFTEEKTRKIISHLLDKTKLEIDKKFNVVSAVYEMQVTRWMAGNFQEPHADKQNLDGSPNGSPGYDVSSVFYINDNFIGGEIYFPNQSLTIKPIKNMLILFPGDIYFLHGVKHVTSGERYTVPAFWKAKEFNGIGLS